jgi:hypothetical protein
MGPVKHVERPEDTAIGLGQFDSRPSHLSLQQQARNVRLASFRHRTMEVSR